MDDFGLKKQIRDKKAIINSFIDMPSDKAKNSGKSSKKGFWNTFRSIDIFGQRVSVNYRGKGSY